MFELAKNMHKTMLVPFFLDTVYIIILLHDVYVVLFVEHGVDG